MSRSFVRWRTAIGLAIGLLLIAGTAAATWLVEGRVEEYLLAGGRLATLKEILVALGAGLVGATVITFSFVMFALQVNVERMPHGLFQRLSSDGRLLGAFFATFMLAVCVLALPLGVEAERVAAVLLGTVWAAGLILMLFMYSYRRALALINPVQQLAIVARMALGELSRWSRRARRLAPLLEEPGDDRHVQEGGSRHDLPRLRFFELNHGWTRRAEQAIGYAMTLAHQYTERGDHEVAGHALNTVIVINAAYVETKGRTFFATNPWFENPRTTDGFINETLEQLRQAARIAVRRGDERQIEQTFHAMAALAGVYARIDYAGEQRPKTHAQLAAGYLADAVKLAVPHDMPDVLMEGARAIGKTAQQFLAHDDALSVMNAVETLRDLAAAGIVKSGHRPVTQTAVAKLAELAFMLLRTRGHDAEFVGKRIREAMTALGKVFMQAPEAPLQDAVSQNLAPYFSTATDQSLPAWMVQLVNTLIEAKKDDDGAKQVIRNIERWSDRLSDGYKELLQTAIEKKSAFMFHVVHGIEHYVGLLLALSNAPACGDHTRDELRKNADRLVHLLSWIPDETVAIQFSETYGVTETLFSLAGQAENRDAHEIAAYWRKLLLRWALKTARHDTGWAIPERALSGLAALAVRSDNPETDQSLVTQLSEALAKPDAPSGERRSKLARELREIGGTYRDPTYATSRIDHAVASVDRKHLVELLERMAGILEGSQPAK